MRTALVYSLLAVVAIVVDNVYALFGHGVRSAAMTWMFLYLALGGGVFYLAIGRLLPGINCRAGYRVFFNSFNSGIATLTVGSLLTGILEIAGTTSPYLRVFTVVGCGFLTAGVVLLHLIARSAR